MTMYQLRRLHLNQESRSLLPDDTVLLFQTTKIGRNPDLVDVVLISSVHSNMISREHTTIYVRAKRDRYECFIKDHSLNGTYVNDYRVLGETELQQGDVIKFGHVNGAAIKPGTYGPQTSAEFAFVFEEAPSHRLSDRRRPITIFGSTRPQESLPFPSQMLVGDGKNLHTASRLPLTNPSMEFAASWQNPAAAGAAAAAAAPFYSLQRFPGYYQAAFPQLNPAYLQSLWPQNPWPSSPAAAHQLQQQRQSAQAAAQYSQLTNQAWMGASAQIAADTAALVGAAGDNRMRTTSSPRVASSVATVQTATATAAAAAAVTCSQRAATAAAAAIAQPPAAAGQNISIQNKNSQLLQSFTKRTPAPPAAAASVAATSTLPVARGNGGTAVQQQYSISSRATEAQRVSRLTECSTAQVIATPSAIDSVKRMECDSSVPSPPKTQQQQQAMAATMFSAVPTSLVGVRRTVATTATAPPQPLPPAATAVQSQVQTPSSASLSTAPSVGERRFSSERIAVTASTGSAFTVSTALPSSVAGSNVGATVPVTSTSTGSLTSAVVSQVSMPPSALAVASTSAVPEERPMEELQRENAERNSRMSGLEELTEDLLEDCGPPRRALSPASTSTEMASAAAADQESSTREGIREESKETATAHSPPHQSPKRRGHGHSDSSRSPTQTPATVEQKGEPRKRRKNNEVAMLLNDLTEVAWHHLARKSTNRITAPTQTRKVYTNDDDDESSETESGDSDQSAKKKQHQKKAMKSKITSSAKNVTFSKSNDSGKVSGRKRGRPKKSSLSETVSITNPGKKKAPAKRKKKKSSSSSNNSNSSASESDRGEREEEVKKPLAAPKNLPGISAAEKIERALDMMKKRRTFPDSDDESSSSSFSSSSSPSPIRRTWGATSQRKTGSAPGTSGIGKKKTGKAGRQSRPVNKVPRKHSRKGTTTSSTSISKKGRKKKNRSSSSESEPSSPSESSSVEWEKMKPVVTPLPSANAPLVFDEWTYHDPEKQCDARSGCKKPQSENVDWVQCDYCNRWYHMECVADGGVAVDNTNDFDCGCREEASKTT